MGCTSTHHGYYDIYDVLVTNGSKRAFARATIIIILKYISVSLRRKYARLLLACLVVGLSIPHMHNIYHI